MSTTQIFENVVLFVESPVSDALDAIHDAPATDAEALVASVVDALGDLVEPAHVPAWVCWESDYRVKVIHLDEPPFTAVATDGDEFYGDFEEGLTLDSYGHCYLSEDGEEVEHTLEDTEVSTVRAYNTSGELVLSEFEWFDTPPTTVDDFRARMATADLAVHGELDAYDVDDYREEEPAAGPVVGASLEDGPYYFGADCGRSGAYPGPGPRELPQIIWRSDANGARGDEWGGNPVVADGFVVCGESSYTASIAAVDLDGTTRWSRTLTDSQSWPIGGACIAGGTVYVCSNKGLHALDAQTGEQRWLNKINKQTYGSPLVVDDLCYVVSGGALNAIATESGRKKWRFKFDGEGPHSAAYADGIIYFTGGDTMYALEARDGKDVLWKSETTGYLGGPMVHGDRIFHKMGSPARVRALSRADGALIWEMEVDTTMLRPGPMAAHRGVLVFKDYEGRVQGVDVETGQRLWRYDLGGKSYGIGNAAPTIASDSVYVVMVEEEGGQRRYLVALDLHDGSLLWKLGILAEGEYMPEEVSWHCTPAVYDGRIFAQTNEGLVALG